MSKKDLEYLKLIYESMNETTFLIEYVGDGNKTHALIIPESLDVFNRDRGVYELQRFHRESDPENFPNIENRKFSIQRYDDNELKYLRDEEDAGKWLDNPGDLKQILHRIVTFGFSFEDLKNYFPRLSEEDYRWLQALG